MQSLAAQLPGQSEMFTKQLLRIAFKFAGEPQTEDVIEQIYEEAAKNEQATPDSENKNPSPGSRTERSE